MDWRSSFKRALVVACLTGMTLGMTSCGKNAVRASEKEFLADRIMRFDNDKQEAAADNHVITNREGAAGGTGTGGGGCGCN